MRSISVSRFLFAVGMFMYVMLGVSPRVTYSGEAPLKKLNVAYPSFSPLMLWFLLEKELGFFREEGIAPEFILVRGGGISVRGLIAGNFDYVHNTGAVMDAIIRARQPFRIVFTAARLNYWLVARPEIRSVSDLKGKTIGTAGLGSITEVTIREILKQHHVDPFKDVALIGVGASQERFAALMSGAVQGTVLSAPFHFKAVQMGYTKVAKATDYVRWPAAGIATTEEKILRQPREVSKMVRAALKGLKIFWTEQEYIISSMMRMFNLSREEATQTYNLLKEEYISSGYFNEETQHSAISLARQAANVTEQIPPDRVFDYGFAKQAEQELKGWRPRVPR